MKQIFFIIFFNTLLFSNITNKEIANMFILGFYGTDANKNSQICKALKNGLAGVILFQKSPTNKYKIKNFKTKNQLKNLTTNIQKCANNRALIAIDQEGGLVQRVKFNDIYPKASLVSSKGEDYAQKIYIKMAKELRDLGFNLNFAPVVDLAINPTNRVIVKYGRSYGNINSVIKYSSIFINAMHKFNIATTLKHFPGHGSSLGDTHKGFVDVTPYWKSIELQPYIKLKNKTDAIMIAHIFNRNLDKNYPASLSKKIVKDLLLEKISFKGVVISDDLQMGAIAKHYTLRNIIKNSINAGVNLMLFANQVHQNRVITLNNLIKTTRELLNSGEINEEQIKQSNIKINTLKKRVNR